MWVNLTDEEGIFLQTIAITELMVALDNTKFLKSEYYDKYISFGDDDIIFKQVLAKTGIGNPASMQIFLYALLVMPKEMLKNKNSEFISECAKRINQLAAETNCIIKTNYRGEDQNDKNTIKFYSHIRNAVAHSKCVYTSENGKGYVTFYDDNMKDRNEHCKITMATYDVGAIFNELNTQIKIYVKDNIKNRYMKEGYPLSGVVNTR